MAYSSTDLETLQSALTSGVMAVTFSDGRKVEYRSLQEIKDAIGIVSGSIATTTGRKRVRQVKVNMEGGFC